MIGRHGTDPGDHLQVMRTLLRCHLSETVRPSTVVKTEHQPGGGPRGDREEWPRFAVFSGL